LLETSFENNTLYFSRLLKFIFTLKPISLKSSRKVMDNRKKITNKSINICDQLLMIMQVLDTYAKNKREEMKLYRKLDDNRQMDIPLI